MKQCHRCEGKGWVDSAHFGPTFCPICKGTGQIANGISTPALKNVETERKPGPTTPMKQSGLRCLIPLKGSQDKVVQIPRTAPKVERENAWAMTQGYRKDKDNDLYYVSIFTSSEDAVILENGFAERDRFIPQVLSYTIGKQEEFPVSQWGHSMPVSYDEQFPLPHKYVAILNSIFYLKKEVHDNRGIEIWGVLCNNGIFDIWEPAAPYHRLTGYFDMQRGGKKKTIMKPQILLLRVFELDRTLSVEHRHAPKDWVTSSGDGAPLTLKRPVIPYDVNDRFYRDFRGKYTLVDIGDRILETLEKFGALRKEELVNDTSQIEIAVPEHPQ